MSPSRAGRDTRPPHPEHSGLTAIYARISLDHGGEEAGVGRQLDDCRHLCERNGWETKEFVDNDISASRYSRKKRPNYLDMVERVRTGEIGRIVVYDVDRLYRQVVELEELIDLADSGKVAIVSLSGDLDLSTGDGRFVARILVAMAQKASDDSSRRLRRQKAERRSRGEPVTRQRTFGWQADLMTPDPVEAAELVAMMESLVAGSSMVDIAVDLNRRGVTTTQGGHWEASNVKDLLSNPRHIGMQVHKPIINEKTGRRGPRQAVGKAQWPAIVDPALFERAQEALAARTAKSWWATGAHTMYPLSGLVRCGRCGQRMNRGGGTDCRVLACSIRRDRGAGCGLSIRAAPTEQHVVGLLFAYVDHLGLAELVDNDGDADKRAVFERDNAQKRLSDLSAAYTQGTIGLAAFETASAQLERHIEQLGTQIRARSASLLTAWAGRPGALAHDWPDLSPSRQQAIIAAAFGEITIMPPDPRAARNRFDTRRIQPGKPNQQG